MLLGIRENLLVSTGSSPAPEIVSKPRTGPSALPEKWGFALALLLIVATVALYQPVKRYPFVSFDDRDYVVRNFQIQSGVDWDTVQWAFTSFYASNWHPLTWLSHALDYQLFHLDPRGHHDTNVLLHALNAALLFWVLWRATGYAGRSFMVAALFALHPINVESVAWVSERKNVLSLFFFLLALGAYRWYALKPRVDRYLAVAGALCPRLDGQAASHYLPVRAPALGLLAAAADVRARRGYGRDDARHSGSRKELLLAAIGEAASVRPFRRERSAHRKGAAVNRRSG